MIVTLSSLLVRLSNQGEKMKNIILVIASVLMTTSLQAEIKIGVVDMQAALQGVSAGKSAKSKLENEFKKKQAEFQKKEQGLKKMKDELEKKALAYTEEQKRKKAMEFNQKMMAFREEVGKSQQAIALRERELTLPIIEELRKQVDVLAKKKGFSIVLEKSEQSVMFAKDDLDLTKDLISAFEKSWKNKKK